MLSSESIEVSRLARRSQCEDDDEDGLLSTHGSPNAAPMLRSGGPSFSLDAADVEEDPVAAAATRAAHSVQHPPPVASSRESSGMDLARNGAPVRRLDLPADGPSNGHGQQRTPAGTPPPAVRPGGASSSANGKPPAVTPSRSAEQRTMPSSPKPWHHQAHAMHDANAAEMAQVCSMLQEAIAMRQRYMKQSPSSRRASDEPPSPVPHYEPFAFPPSGAPERSNHVFEFRQGVMVVWQGCDLPSLLQEYEAAHRSNVDFHQFTLDLGRLHDICSAGPVYTFCVRRLALLESRYKLHTMEKEGAELAQMRANPHRDYYNCRKVRAPSAPRRLARAPRRAPVAPARRARAAHARPAPLRSASPPLPARLQVDTHIHLAAAMNQKHLLRFIKRKMKVEPDVPVIAKGGRTLTLREVCDELRLSPYDINLDSLGMHADSSTFRRFDKFNLKYNPLGDASLREIFIKTDNFMNGRYLAELTKELFCDLEESKYVNAEYRLSIYGRKPDEWHRLADWVVLNRLWSPNNRWLVQVPRLYHLYHSAGSVSSFEHFLSNLFTPLFEATRDPAAHPHLHLFLQQVVGFDCVDDESKPDTALPTSEHEWERAGCPREPREWSSGANPHYAYYIYYLYANLLVLNQFRQARGFNTFDFRPHSGEAGELSHLHSTFLCAHAINHGLMLRRSPPLQYLYYLTQIGIAMSPLSNNMLFCELARNPFPLYFVRGLNVCLSTDDPLMFHYTKEPLMEEYCIARHTWQLSPVDLSEIFRASVLHSSFERCVKAYWLGPDFWRPGAAGNDITRTNVPDIRLHFRDQAHREELHVVYESAAVATALQATISAAASYHPRPPNQGALLRAAGGSISVDTLSQAHEAKQNGKPSPFAPVHPPERLMPNAQGRRQTATEEALARALAAARGAAMESVDEDGAPPADQLVLGVPLSAAVAIGVGAAAVAASAFALGAAVAGLFAYRGRRTRKGGTGRPA